MKVFLGGTWNESTWRYDLIPMLEAQGIDYFNPIVDDWDEAAQQRELQERENCDICLYCITPRMTGVYSIAEVVDDSNKRPLNTVLVVLSEDTEDTQTLRFDEGQKRSLEQVGSMVYKNGGKYFFGTDALKYAVWWIDEVRLGDI